FGSVVIKCCGRQGLPYGFVESDGCIKTHLAVGIHLKYARVEWVSREAPRLFGKEVIERTTGRQVAHLFKIGVATSFLDGPAIFHEVGIDDFLRHAEATPTAKRWRKCALIQIAIDIRSTFSPDNLRVNG